MGNKYWVRKNGVATGNWSDPAHWSNTPPSGVRIWFDESGWHSSYTEGLGGASAPMLGDTAYLLPYATTADQVVTMDVDVVCDAILARQSVAYPIKLDFNEKSVTCLNGGIQIESNVAVNVLDISNSNIITNGWKVASGVGLTATGSLITLKTITDETVYFYSFDAATYNNLKLDFGSVDYGGGNICILYGGNITFNDITVVQKSFNYSNLLVGAIAEGDLILTCAKWAVTGSMSREFYIEIDAW